MDDVESNNYKRSPIFDREYYDNLEKYCKDIESIKIINTLNKDKYTIIRVDGHKFSNFTRAFDKPDDDLIYAMIETTKDIFKEFIAITGFTQSDEITLLFPPQESFIYSGRIDKLLSLISGMTSARFNYHLLERSKNIDPDSKKYKFMTSGLAYFDSRIFHTDDPYLIFKWRYMNTFRNGINYAGRMYFSNKIISNKGIGQIIGLLRDTANKNLNDFPSHLIYGTWVKKENKLVDFIDYKTKEPIKSIRTFYPTYTFEEMPSNEWVLLQKI